MFLECFLNAYRGLWVLFLRGILKNRAMCTGLFEGSVVMLNKYDTGISLDLFLCGIREETSVKWLLSQIDERDIFYDIGANFGYYTVIVAKKVSKVVSFEPYSKSFKLLRKNVELNNLTNVELFNLGLGDKNDERMLYVPSKKNLASFYNGLHSDKNIISKELVHLFSLDYFMERSDNLFPTWIKMDIEGYEYFVIKGAVNTLKMYKPRLFVELHPKILGRPRLKELIKTLLDSGYKIDNFVLENQKAPIAPAFNMIIRKAYNHIYKNIVIDTKHVVLENLYDNDLFLDGHIAPAEVFLSHV